MRVERQRGALSEVGAVQVRDHVEQQAVNLLDGRVVV